jgi:hypothetical protein
MHILLEMIAASILLSACSKATDLAVTDWSVNDQLS